MTSRERVEKVLNHEIPDYIPNCWGGCETAGMHVSTYQRLVDLLGLEKRPSRVDTFMFNAVMDEDVLLKMQGDMLLLASPIMCARPLRAKEGWNRHRLFGIDVELSDNYSLESDDRFTYLLNDGKRAMRSPKGSYYFDFIPDGDLFDDAEVPDPADYHPSHDFPDEKLRALENIARQAYESTDFALCMGETITDLQLMPGGMVAWYEAMLTEPEIVDEYLSKNVDAALDQITLLDQAVGKYCSVLSIAHDLGDHKNVTMGASLFRSCYKPHYSRLFHGWHERTRMKVNLHSCGAISEIIPDLIECGVDVLNPVQISANDMDVRRLKSLVGNALVFYGGSLDCIQCPPTVDAQAVYQKVRENISVLAEGGNYLFAGVHNTAADTPREHLEAALRAYRDVRGMYR